MVKSVDGANSVPDGEKTEELVPPVFAADLAPNVRAGFDSTCGFHLVLFRIREIHRQINLRSPLEGGAQFPLSDGIWKSSAMSRCKDLMWHAMKRMLWMNDRRARHGLQEQTSPCYVCLQEEDTADHILM
jgi:hypothetical protein